MLFIKTVPLAFCLMSRKREDDNLQLFKKLKPLIPWLKSDGVVLEFEHRVI